MRKYADEQIKDHCGGLYQAILQLLSIEEIEECMTESEKNTNNYDEMEKARLQKIEEEDLARE